MKRKNHASLILLAAVGLGFAVHPRAEAVMVVAPNSAAGTEGNENNAFPFNLADDVFEVPSQTQRYQQVYMASQFAALDPTGGGMITELRFRRDGGIGGPFSSTLPGIRIDLSTTRSVEGAMSIEFASNVGADDVIVFGAPGGSPLALSSASIGPVGGPNAFDIIIPLTTPFFYNPALGNLLMDVRNFGGGRTTTFDSVGTAGDGVARVFTMANGVSAPTANGNATSGLVTAFTIVPEPSTWAMLLGGAALFGARKRFGRPM